METSHNKTETGQNTMETTYNTTELSQNTIESCKIKTEFKRQIEVHNTTDLPQQSGNTAEN